MKLGKIAYESMRTHSPEDKMPEWKWISPKAQAAWELVAEDVSIAVIRRIANAMQEDVKYAEL